MPRRQKQLDQMGEAKALQMLSSKKNLCRETRNCVKTFFEKCSKFFLAATPSLIRPLNEEGLLPPELPKCRRIKK